MENNNNKSIKILTAFHKPYRLFNNDIIVPIHVGRKIAFQKSKDGVISDSDFSWLMNNTIGDDTGENISDLNREFCELTAIYWAWKNYDKLGNPDYVGLMHYRTFFLLEKSLKEKFKKKDLGYNKEVFNEILNNYDGLLLEKVPVITSGIGIRSITFTYIEKYYPKIYNTLKELTDIRTDKPREERPDIHFKNMFVLPREDFFEYCEIMFDLLFKMKEMENINKPRDLGFIAEPLSSIIFSHFAKTKNRKFLETPWLLISDEKKSFKTQLKELKYYLKLKFSKNKNNIEKYYRYKYINNNFYQ